MEKTNQKKQRYKCKKCEGYSLKIIKKHYPHETKDLALKLYTDKVKIKTIARSLEIPYETIRSWIKVNGEKAIKKNRKENRDNKKEKI